MTKSIEILGAEFILHPSGAIFWTEKSILIISDVHLGKISHFRKHGSGIPEKAIAGNFEKLSSIVAFFDAEKIFFLGDLFHSSLNLEWQLFEKWVENISAEITLIEGNHDIISPLKYEKIGIEVVPEINIHDFFFTHHPEKREGKFNFSGHLHPGVKLYGTGKQQLKVSCFYKTNGQLILPAFGEFTGNYFISPQEGDEIFVLGKEEIILLPLAFYKRH